MRALELIKRHAPTILTCAGAAGVVATSVATAKATTKASILLAEAEECKGEELTAAETLRVAGPVYIPAVLFGAATITCMFGANLLNKRQQAALVSAYALIDNSYKQYKNTVKELYGEELHQNIVDHIADAHEVHISSECLCTGCVQELDEETSDPVLWYDEYSERYFEATIERVLLAEYHLNRNFVLRGYTVLNEFYEFLGLEPTDYGSVVGWTMYNGDDLNWIDFNHHKAILDDGLECYILEMPFGPRRRLLRRLPFMKFAKITRSFMERSE